MGLSALSSLAAVCEVELHPVNKDNASTDNDTNKASFFFIKISPFSFFLDGDISLFCPKEKDLEHVEWFLLSRPSKLKYT